MSAFNTKTIIPATVSQINNMAKAIEQEFTKEGYEVKIDPLMSGGCDISISKGNLFKALLGMRSALKVVLSPTLNGVQFDAHIGIFGQQFVPAAIAYLFCWPLLIAQVWGMVQQSKLDDRALAAAQSVLVPGMNNLANSAMNSKRFCTACGAEVPADAGFCPKCGTRLS